MEDRTWMLLGALIYCSAIVLAAALIVRRKPVPQTLMFGVIGLGFVLQTVGLYLRGMAVQSCPIGNPYEVLQFIAWSLVLIYLLTGPVFRMTLFGGFTATVAAVLGVTASVFPSWDSVEHVAVFGGNPWIETHASLALFSYGVFGLLAASSVMFLLQNYGLKRKRFTGLFRYLPSIVQLEHVNTRLLVVGTVVFSFSMVIGVIYFARNPQLLTSFKLIPTTILWMAYLIVLVLRLVNRVVGNRLAWYCTALFIASLLTLWPVEINRTITDEKVRSTSTEWTPPNI